MFPRFLELLRNNRLMVFYYSTMYQINIIEKQKKYRFYILFKSKAKSKNVLHTCIYRSSSLFNVSRVFKCYVPRMRTTEKYEIQIGTCFTHIHFILKDFRA